MPATSLTSWMKEMYPVIKDLPLSRISIPGTHDSGTYSLGWTPSPDMTQQVKDLWDGDPWWAKIVGAPRTIIRGWAISQSLDFQSQLENGVRYLDIRIANDNGSPRICHSLYASKNSVKELISSTSEFVQENPGELVILDFNHFYAMDSETHKSLINHLVENLREFMVNWGDAGAGVTFGDVISENEKTGKAIVFYRGAHDAGFPLADEIAASMNKQFGENRLWLNNQIQSDWPNLTSLDELLTKLEQEEKSLQAGAPPATEFFVLQAILTPGDSAGFYLAHTDITFPSQSLREWSGNAGQKIVPILMKHFSAHNITIVDNYNASIGEVIISANQG